MAKKKRRLVKSIECRMPKPVKNPATKKIAGMPIWDWLQSLDRYPDRARLLQTPPV